MSEIILNAILHLFAIFSSRQDAADRKHTRELVHRYLSENLHIEHVDEYLLLFDEFLSFYIENPDESFAEHQASTICSRLRGLILRQEQYVVLLRFLELAKSSEHDSEFLARLVQIVAGNFQISSQTCMEISVFINHTETFEKLSKNFLLVGPNPSYVSELNCQILEPVHFNGAVTVLFIPDIDTFLFTPHHQERLTLDGIPVRSGTFYTFSQGAVLRDYHGNPVYFSDVSSRFYKSDEARRLVFEGDHVDFRFPGSDNGLHDFLFTAKSGQMIGVMGGSGVGKSTLMDILNGSQPPDSGHVLLNGMDLYGDREALEGVIGFIPQDDLLFEDLTVYENVYLSSRLCLAHLDEAGLTERVEGVLRELNQIETKDLKVGSPVEKIISGGQRKRLNIALELIRESSIFFVDEPTSGLSSSDSLNVMTLLKEQASKGSLVIVIIHQPSSDIFKMFDQLWVLDKGGRPIFTGSPMDSISYFRKAVHQAGTNECVCSHCGNVTPEQIFDIIEMKQLDESGYVTDVRRFPPEEWHQRHLGHRKETRIKSVNTMPKGDIPRALWRPGLMGQLWVFLKRNVLTRLANRQYLLVNFLEAPLLALIIALLSRYSDGAYYVFGDNKNLAAYLFMSVIVSLFLGLSVSAEEIIRDRKVRQRESFLHLSWYSYISAKALYLCGVSAFQTFLYVLVGNYILEIPDYGFESWLVLFSCHVCACMIGLNISAAFRTVVTVYILVPLLLVPQILLGGIVIPFDDLISRDTGHNRVPLVGNIMPSRWGFEAIVVGLYGENAYMKPFYKSTREISRCDFILDCYVPELQSHIDFPFLKADIPEFEKKLTETLELLEKEFNRLGINEGLKPGVHDNDFTPDRFSRHVASKLKTELSHLVARYRRNRSASERELRRIEMSRIKKMGEHTYLNMKKRYHNCSVTDLVRNRKNLDDYRISGGKIVRLSDPVFTTDTTWWGMAPFFAGEKQFGGLQFTTFSFNLYMLWFLSLLLYLSLFYNLLPMTIECGSTLWQKISGMAGKISRGAKTGFTREV